MDGGMYMMPAGYAGPAQPHPSLIHQQQQQQQMMLYGVEIPNRVFVGGCPYNMTELELSNFFSQYGEVKDSKIITDRDGGKSKGYGFVTFVKEEDAVKVYSMGSIYYQQKKLNVSKAVHKYGGQYPKANQEYVNGQRMIWMQPNGNLVSPQDNGWGMEQWPSHTQPVKPYFPMMAPVPAAPPHNMYYNQPNSYQMNTNAWIGLGQPMSGQLQTTGAITMTTDYNQSASIPTYQLSATTDTHTSTGQDSLESSGSSGHQSNDAQTTNGKKFAIDMKLVDEKTKQLSLDSAYTSEADLDASHNSTATNSRATSPKLAAMPEKVESSEESEKEADKVGEKDAEKKVEDNAPAEGAVDNKAEKKEKGKKPKPQQIFTEFTPSSHATNTAFSPASPQVIPQQYYQIPQQYVSPPISPLTVQIGPQGQYFSYLPTPELQPQVVAAPPGNTVM